MDSGAAKLRLEKLRAWRQRPSRNVSIEQAVSRVADEALRADRGLTRAMRAWAGAAPGELADCCRPVSLRGGTLELACDSPSAAYEVNRWLQADGVAALAKEGLAVVRVRLVGKASGRMPQPKAGQGGKKPGGFRRPSR